MDYAIIILTLSRYKEYFLQNYYHVAVEHQLQLSDYDHVYDWIIKEALKRILSINYQSNIVGHYKHDIYRCIYDTLGRMAEIAIKEQINTHQLQFLKGENIKPLVAGDTLILAKGIKSHV